MKMFVDCNQNMVSAIILALEVTIYSLAERMDLHVNKLTTAVKFTVICYPGIDNWAQSWVRWVEPGLPRKPSS